MLQDDFFSRKKCLHLRCLFKGTLPLSCEFAISHHQRSLDGVAREWRYVLASQFGLLFVGERSFHMFPPSSIIESKEWNVLILLMWHFVLIDIPHLCCLTHLGELYFTKPKCLVILKHFKGTSGPEVLRSKVSWLPFTCHGASENSSSEFSQTAIVSLVVVLSCMGQKTCGEMICGLMMIKHSKQCANPVSHLLYCYTMKCYSSTAATGTQAGTFRFT